MFQQQDRIQQLETILKESKRVKVSKKKRILLSHIPSNLRIKRKCNNNSCQAMTKRLCNNCNNVRCCSQHPICNDCIECINIVSNKVAGRPLSSRDLEELEEL